MFAFVLLLTSRCLTCFIGTAFGFVGLSSSWSSLKASSVSSNHARPAWLWHKCCNGCSLSGGGKLQTPEHIFPVFSLCWNLSRFHLCFVHCSTQVSEHSQRPARACFLEALVLPTALFSQMTSASLSSLSVTLNLRVCCATTDSCLMKDDEETVARGLFLYSRTTDTVCFSAARDTLLWSPFDCFQWVPVWHTLFCAVNWRINTQSWDWLLCAAAAFHDVVNNYPFIPSMRQKGLYM